MIEKMIFAFDVIFPLFALVTLGMALKRGGLLLDSWVAVTNRFVFRFALPAMMFNSIYAMQVNLLSYLPALSFVLFILSVMFALLLVLVPRFVSRTERRGVVIQGLVQSNTILLGIPLMNNLFGAIGVAELTAFLTLVIPFFNIIAVLSFALYAAPDAPRPTKRGIARGIVTNPLIIATLSALALVLFNLRLPLSAERSIAELAKMASPLSLLALGAGFQLGSVGTNLKGLLAVSATRLVVAPLVLVSLAVAAGYSGITLAAMLIIFAAPLAVASFVMSYEAGADSEFCGQLIVFTTLGSSVSLFGFIFALSSLGLL